MTDNPYDPDYWKRLVGGFVMSFGEIESITYRLWREHVPDRRVPRQLRTRASKLICALSENTEVEEVRALLHRAHQLASKRNVIAHSPVRVQVKEVEGRADPIVELAVESAEGDGFIDEWELTELVSEAEAIVSELYLALHWTVGDE